MFFQVSDLLAMLNDIAPFDQAEAWDNVGLLVGNPEDEVSTIMIGLDPTEELLDEALAAGAQAIITHHPLIFHPLKSLRTDEPSGSIIRKALTHQVSVIGCHTNLDVVAGGVNEIFAQLLNLKNISPLTINDAGNGFGRLGELDKPIDGEIFLKQLLDVLDASAVRIAGPLPKRISTIAVCGGSGSDLAEQAFAKGADIYISAEIKHSTARWAESIQFCIIDADHFPTENLVVPALAKTLRDRFSRQGIPMDIRACETQKNPFRHVMKYHNNLLYSQN